MKNFRPYQHEASAAILKAWGEHRSCLASMATGAGKTLVAAGTAAKVVDKGRVLFLANRNELCIQPLDAFRDQLGYVPELEKAEDTASLDARVVVGSVQTLARTKRLERFPRDHFGYIFADEAHMSMAPSWKRILDHFAGAKVCGITATPFRADAKDLREIYEVEAYRKNLFDLVDEGWLCNPDHVYKLQSAISLAQVRIKQTAEGKDYDVTDAANAIEPYFLEIARELKEKHSYRHILAFLPLVASSQKFVEACRSVGLNAVHIDGDDPERDQKLMSFRRGEITLLSNSNLLHTGVDIECCDATLCLRPTRSKVLYQQIIGRSTRCLPGTLDGHATTQARLQAIAASAKPNAVILDPMWLTEDHDLVTPSFLIAETQEIAEEMNKRAGTSYSLRKLNRQIQLEREEVIRRRLEATARFREGTVHADWFAAAIHAHTLVNYEAVFAWEFGPVKNMDKNILSQAGIDPESVRNQGHARAVIREVYKRRARGLAEIRALAPRAERVGVDDQLWTLTAKQVRMSR
jgi:superfamily II DNA or RNA helicase